MTIDPNSLERLIPDEIRSDESFGRESLAIHLARYEFAAGYVRPGRMLDIACGVGYGTRLILDRGPEDLRAVGVDISSVAIDYAQRRYGGGNLEYLVADAMEFADDSGFDTVVSLETIEHLQNPVGFVANLTQLLRPGGVLICSVPSTPSVDVNPYHLHDFSERSFRKMFEQFDCLTEIACFRQIQPFAPIEILRRREARTKDIRTRLFKYYAQNPERLLKRIWSTLYYGFTNRVITVVMQKTK